MMTPATPDRNSVTTFLPASLAGDNWASPRLLSYSVIGDVHAVRFLLLFLVCLECLYKYSSDGAKCIKNVVTIVYL